MSLGPMSDEIERNQPHVAPGGDPVDDAVVGDEEEQRRQRGAMERELHLQNSALDPSALHNQHIVPGAAPTALPEHERIRGETLTEAQLLACRGKPLLDAGGEEIGPISAVYLDESTGIPKWLGAQVGSLMGSQRVVAPVFGSYSFKDAISAPYARDVILSAEVASTGEITPEQDAALYLRFGVPVSTERSASGLPAGQDLKHVARSERWLHRSAAALGASIAATRRLGRWRPWTRAA